MERTARYLVILIAVMALWNSVIIKPLRIFSVFLHEMGHALMAVVFGHGIQAFRVNINESGYVIAQSRGWLSSFMITNGGYLGSVLLALLILYLKRTWFRNYILGMLAIIFLGISIRFSGFSFTLVYSIIFTVAVLLLYMIQNDTLNGWIIDIVGIASVAYAIYDTFVDTIIYNVNHRLHFINGWQGGQVTDAMKLESMTGIPAVIWGIIWLGISLLAVNAVILKTSGRRR